MKSGIYSLLAVLSTSKHHSLLSFEFEQRKSNQNFNKYNFLQLFFLFLFKSDNSYTIILKDFAIAVQKINQLLIYDCFSLRVHWNLLVRRNFLCRCCSYRSIYVSKIFNRYFRFFKQISSIFTPNN